MRSHFEHVVVGGGPMGSAAAKYLAASGARVLLIAAPEPRDGVPGLHSSHGDVSRLTRGLDSSEVWARMAKASISRYRDLEKQSGIPFFSESGCLTLLDCSRPENTVKAVELQKIGLKQGVASESLDAQQLSERFPALDLPAETRGFHEPAAAGWLNPRNYVRAQIVAGQQSGLEVWSDIVTSASVTVAGVALTTASGRRCTSDQALFAMGAHSLFDMPVPLGEELTAFARTVVRVELDNDQLAELAELAELPSMIVRGAADAQNCYLVPPMEYPDGKHYIKIGGGRRAHSITSRSELEDWYAGDGDPAVADALMHRLAELLPATRPERGISQACAITVTSSGLPRIEKLRPNVGILTGGNGHAAKSGDEAGRLGALLMLADDGWSEGYQPGVFAR